MLGTRFFSLLNSNFLNCILYLRITSRALLCVGLQMPLLRYLCPKCERVLFSYALSWYLLFLEMEVLIRLFGFVMMLLLLCCSLKSLRELMRKIRRLLTQSRREDVRTYFERGANSWAAVYSSLTSRLTLWSNRSTRKKRSIPWHLLCVENCAPSFIIEGEGVWSRTIFVPTFKHDKKASTVFLK